MMDYVANLAARGLISPDALSGLTQQIADLKNQRPWETGGGAGAETVYAPRGYGEATEPPLPPRPPAPPKQTGGEPEKSGPSLNARLISQSLGISVEEAQQALENGGLEKAFEIARSKQVEPVQSKGGNVAGRKNIQGQLGKFSLPDLWDDFQAGLNDQQIANKYNVTKSAINQRRKAWGIEPKPRGRPWPSRDQE